MHEYSRDSYKVQVAGHELFGHGSGKQFFKDKDGKCPEFTDPLNGEKFTSCYNQGETYNERFGEISTSYEECRADLSGLYLGYYPEMYKIFNWDEKNSSDLQWLSMMISTRKGILGIPSSYSVEQKKWKQAHTQGAFVISQFLIKNQKSKIIDVQMNGTDDFYISVDKKNLMKEGHELIGKLLHAMQVYKSSGAVDRAKKLYAEYSKVPDEYLKMKKIMLSRRRPIGLRLFSNILKKSDLAKETSIDPDQSVPELINYPETFEGIIYSFADRVPFSTKLYTEMLQEW